RLLPYTTLFRSYRIGSAHRLAFHLPGRGLWGLVLPQGPAGAGEDRRPERARSVAAQGGGGGERAAEGPPVRTGVAPLWRSRRPARQDVSDLGAGGQARHRRHARGTQPQVVATAAGRGGEGPRLRSRGPRRGPADLRPAAGPGAVRRAGAG